MPGAGARVCMGLTIVTLLGSVLTPATAVTLYNGFGTGDSFNTGSFATVGRSFIEGMPADTDQAATFTVPVEGHFSLDAIEIAVTLFTGMNELDVFLVGHDAAAGPLGAPDEGQLLESFHLSNAIVRDVPGPPGTESIVFIPSLTRPLLKAGVQYWVMLSTPDPNTLIQWWAAAEELGPGPTVKAERFNLGPWEVVNATGPGQAFRIQGTPAVLDVTIDIKPGEDPNPINPKSQGNISVAILSTSSFNAPTTVRISSLMFGRTGNEQSLNRCNSEDVNRDGFLDLICQFDTQTAAFQTGDTKGILKGTTVEGTPFQGEDSVRITL